MRRTVALSLLLVVLCCGEAAAQRCDNQGPCIRGMVFVCKETSTNNYGWSLKNPPERCTVSAPAVRKTARPEIPYTAKPARKPIVGDVPAPSVAPKRTGLIERCRGLLKRFLDWRGTWTRMCPVGVELPIAQVHRCEGDKRQIVAFRTSVLNTCPHIRLTNTGGV